MKLDIIFIKKKKNGSFTTKISSFVWGVIQSEI